ncbi:flagellar basal body-associated FliL family protein [Dryocola sp. BD626]|uniref:flagellar basal body-associated FliL family protein n=1 Tax=Dryocola sp. BD626 TaxID=3133273 RepID=UPI003F4FD9DB
MKKTILIGLLVVLLAAIVGGGAAAGAIYFMKSSAPASADSKAAEKAKVKKESQNIFVSLSDSVVTLHDVDNDDHYMLVELALVVDNDVASKKALADEPLYQSIIVATLADMKYEEARTLKISELRKLLTDSLAKELSNREVTIPYNDVLVKKVVFQ